MSKKEQLEKLIAEALNKDSNELGDLTGKKLFEDLEFDSISIMELVVNIEETFGIDLGEGELIDTISSFDLLLELIEKSN